MGKLTSSPQIKAFWQKAYWWLPCRITISTQRWSLQHQWLPPEGTVSQASSSGVQQPVKREVACQPHSLPSTNEALAYLLACRLPLLHLHQTSSTHRPAPCFHLIRPTARCYPLAACPKQVVEIRRLHGYSPRHPT